MKSVNLCRELFDRAVERTASPRAKLSVVSNGVLPEGSPAFVEIEENDGPEIFCSKITYLQVFHEARVFLQERNGNTSLSDADTYFATLGLLLTTPEDRTNLNLHEAIILQRLKEESEHQGKLTKEGHIFLAREIMAVMLLLTSSLNRVNKSPSLWLLYRKLFTILKELFPAFEVDYQRLFLTSAERHFSNFYCWNTFRWVYDLESPSTQAQLLTAVWDFSSQHPKDSSAWWALGHSVLNLSALSEYSSKDYNSLRSRFGFEQSPHHASEVNSVGELTQYSSEIIKFIEIGEVSDWPPFGCLARLLRYVTEKDQAQFLQKWYNEIQAFEKKYFEINKNSVSLAIYKNDRGLIFQRSVQSLLHRKTLLKKIGVLVFFSTAEENPS
ncbi:LAME_0G15742g1_1 [Lachancea meyersii CBS 8951]|uniref:LAME_0G15742g1_1 n=1 Tax=Lachancea meyersii CBS 8951 TaxID=1266667 RepID=A0A1G4KAV8_9SACH|nr:LAME_0G15742g1_1 [Lachancea meyersii CBS 8951]